MATPIVIVADVLDTLVAASQAIATLGPILKQMQADGRTHLTSDEWQTISSGEAGSARALLEAVQSAKSQGK